MKRLFPVEIELDVPEGATHYAGDLREDPTWFKCTQVGVVGDHWWQWSLERREWVLSSHHKPHWVKALEPLSVPGTVRCNRFNEDLTAADLDRLVDRLCGNAVGQVPRDDLYRAQVAILALIKIIRGGPLGDWIAVADRPPPTHEPVVYTRPDTVRPGRWKVGIAYWTVSQKWSPECQSEQAPTGFTHYKPLGPRPREE